MKQSEKYYLHIIAFYLSAALSFYRMETAAAVISMVFGVLFCLMQLQRNRVKIIINGAEADEIVEMGLNNA